MSARTAFVIGARGFVGSNTVRSFLASGWRVHCFGPAMQPDLLADLKDRITETDGSVEQTDAPPREEECLPPMPLGGGGRGQCRSGLRSAGRSRSSSSNRGT